MIISIALVILWPATLYLAGLGLVALFRPVQANRFLSGFAQTKFANGFEAAIRFVIGMAFVASAEVLRFPLAFRVFGAFLAVTAFLMILLPGYHRRVAARSVAMIGPYVRLIGAASLALASLLGVIIWGGVESA